MMRKTFIASIIVVLALCSTTLAQNPRSYIVNAGTSPIAANTTITLDMQISKYGLINKNPTRVTIWTSDANASNMRVLPIEEDGWSVKSDGNTSIRGPYFYTYRNMAFVFNPGSGKIKIENNSATTATAVFVLIAEYR